MLQMKQRRWILLFLALLLTIPLLALYGAGSLLSSPANHPVGPPPPELGATAVEFDTVHGWLVKAGERHPCLVLMHGVRADRSSMVARAAYFKTLGYTSLLFDFQAHGETPGDKITFGYRESANAHAAVDYLRHSGLCTRIGAIGVSMGGAASLLGPSPIPVDALVLESVYPRIEDAVRDRVERIVGQALVPLAPLLYEQLPLRLDVPLAELHPVDAIRHVRCPVLVIAGSADKSTHLAESEALYAGAPEPKQLWIVRGAGHVDLYHFAGKDYEKQVGRFLQTYLNASP